MSATRRSSTGSSSRRPRPRSTTSTASWATTSPPPWTPPPSRPPASTPSAASSTWWRRVTGPADLLAALPELHRDGFLLLFGQAVTVDHDDSSVNLLWLVPTGLGLPDRDAYSDDSEAAVALREAYVAHVAAQLVNMGDDPEVAAAEAASILELETRLAEQQLKGEERRDPSNTLNRHTLDELEALTPGLPIRSHLVALGLGDVASLNVQQPRYMAALAGILADTDPAVLRSYSRFHVLNSAAETLPAAFDDEHFAFYGRLIEGKQEQQQRYKRVLAALGLRHGRGPRADLRHRGVHPGRQGAGAGHGRGHPRRDAPVARDPHLDGRGHPREGPGQAGRRPGEDRLPRRVA